MPAEINVTLAEYKPIATYKPKIGDFIVWHGWFTHYYGIINGIKDEKLRTVKSGIPFLLFTLKPDEIDTNYKLLSLSRIRQSGSGEYAVQQNGIWYI